jgi:hypothetical protein
VGGHTQAARRDALIARDGNACVWCAQPFSALNRPTTEHLIARVKGGPSWPENELAACRRCNSERGHASPVQWRDELRACGRTPNDAVIHAALLRLATRIATDGGAWRIRRTLAAELRKIGVSPPFRV